ncbi:MAG: hypothetical protein EXR69_04005 [Myxococcales bacterium]|nr:hypothetical protein [Myxococcales bacterium]
MLWIALALADPTSVESAVPAPVVPAPVVPAPALETHALTVSVKSPPGGTVVEATAFGETRMLRDPGVGVHTATFVGASSRFTRLEVGLNQNGVHTSLYDGIVPLSDAREDVVSFVLSGGARPTALRTAYAPSASVRMWTAPTSVTRYGWAAVLALYAAVLLISTTRRP